MPEMLARILQVGESTASEATVRNHAVTIDRPEAKGGGDRGAMGGELLLSALGGCFMSNLIAAVKGRDLDITNLAVTVRGDLDGTPPVYRSLVLEVSGEGADVGELDKMVVISERGCIVANTLKGSVPVSAKVL